MPDVLFTELYTRKRKETPEIRPKSNENQPKIRRNPPQHNPALKAEN
jgi:hypothetical protein